jgi:serine/threonine-protein kinase ATR
MNPPSLNFVARMNAAPLSTQLPVPNLGDSQSGYNPAEFIVFLRSLNNNHLGDHCRRIPSKDRDNWTTIVDGLVDHFLRSFYLPDAVSWDGVQERLEVTQATLEVIRRVFLRVDGIFTGSEVLVRKIFVRLMDFCRVLDLWIGTTIENIDDLSKLQEYREMVMSVLISVLRGLGNNNPVPGQQQSACESLREMLREGLEVCRGKL